MHIHISGFSRWLMVKNLPTNAGDAGLRDPPEEGNGNPLEYYCLGNPKYRGAWQAIVHGVVKESDVTYQLNNNNNIHMSVKLYI